MGRTLPLDVLERIDVASPCSVDWDTMQGDDRVRFCSQCKLHVYNLSAVSREEAVELIIAKEGGLCGRFFRRADGTVITTDCPIGMRALVSRAGARIGRIAAAAACMLGSALALGAARVPGAPRLRSVEPFRSVCEWLQPPAPTPVIRVITPARGLYRLQGAVHINRAPDQVQKGGGA